MRQLKSMRDDLDRIYCLSQLIVGDASVHLRCRNLPVPEGPLDQVQIAGFVVEPGGGGVAERANGCPPPRCPLVPAIGRTATESAGREAG